MNSNVYSMGSRMKTNDDLHTGHAHIYRRINERFDFLEQLLEDLKIDLTEKIDSLAEAVKGMAENIQD